MVLLSRKQRLESSCFRLVSERYKININNVMSSSSIRHTRWFLITGHLVQGLKAGYTSTNIQSDCTISLFLKEETGLK